MLHSHLDAEAKQCVAKIWHLFLRCFFLPKTIARYFVLCVAYDYTNDSQIIQDVIWGQHNDLKLCSRIKMVTIQQGPNGRGLLRLILNPSVSVCVQYLQNLQFF